MDIILIGSGNTATVLGRKSHDAGHRVLQVYSRNSEHANRLATRLGENSVSSISLVKKKADLMIIALRDEAITPFMQEIGEINSLAVHTAGALPIQSVKNPGGLFGVLYPLQSLRKEIEDIPPLTILVDGINRESRSTLKEFALSIAESVIEADDDTRLKYHLAATVVNNFTNYLFMQAAVFCEKENISFSVLQPLMEETVMRLRNTPPAAAQTGPAMRNDQLTMNRHRELLAGYPDLLHLYDLLTAEIQKFVLGFKL
jgi:predicted short-subunit dehydrogenase-like oxidoreductase (DUF2520 family)